MDDQLKREVFDPATVQFKLVCRKLSLTKDQLKQAQPLFDKMLQDKKSVSKELNTGTISKDVGDDHLKTIVDTFEKNFIALFTPSQLENFKKLKEQNKTGSLWL